jgi:hypothetical protein
MSSSAVRLTRFKLPKIKFSLTGEELLVIFMSAFMSYILYVFVGKPVYWPLFVGQLVVGVWAYTILNQYTLKERMSTGGKNKRVFFSENFITDLVFFLLGNIAGFFFCAITYGDGPIRLFTSIIISLGMRCLARTLYYHQ